MKMLTIALFLLVGATNLSCSSNSATSAKGRVVSGNLTIATCHIEDTFSKKRTPLEFNSGGVVDTCNSYFSQKQSSEIVENVNNVIAAQDYLICDTVKAVQESIENTFTQSGITYPGNTIANQLALDSFPSSVYQRTDAANMFMSQMFGTILKVGMYGANADTPDWYYALTVEAILDLDGDGTEDWIVWLQDKSKTGNYSNMAVFSILNVSKDSPLSLVPLP